MRTKIILIVLALMLAAMLPSGALAENCALCGEECTGSAYLCADCLVKLLRENDAPAALEITDILTNADGSVTVLWADDAACGPYSVYYELLAHAPVPFGWTAAQGVQTNAVTLHQLVPGVSYVFTVEDAQGNRATANYYAPVPEEGNEIGAKIRVHTKLIKNHNGRVLDYPWRVHEITGDADFAYGLYTKLSYVMLVKTRHYAFSLAVEAPNGFADVVYSGELTLNYGKSEVPAWGFVEMDDYFDCLERYYGGVPTGEYKVSLYFDGKHIFSTAFEVTE